MDSFLSDLYKENMEKQAGVELKEFYDSLSVEQLEQVLGLTKVAVGEPELPDGGPVREYLDATEKAPAKKTTPPELPTESATPSVNNTAAIESGKQLLQASTGKPEPTTPFVPREIKTTDDPDLGSRDAESKTASILDRVLGGVERGAELVSGKGVGKIEDELKRQYQRTGILKPGVAQQMRGELRAAADKDISKERKKILGTRAGLGLAAVGGTAAAMHKGKTAEKRAEFLITALRAIKDAPEHVKHAAAKYVGERL
jgi:hypothetical protein